MIADSPVVETKGCVVADEERMGKVPTEPVTKAETVVLVRSLLVDWQVLEHLQQHKVNAAELRPAMAADCCKPDGGTCCVNRR
jgi:hypothetical protein